MAAVIGLTRDLGGEYLDRSQFSSLEEQRAAKAKSSTVYVGGLSVYTAEEQLHAVFSFAGTVRRVIMGLHRVDRRPCGFCFVEFVKRKAAERAELLLNGLVLEDHELKVEMDPGFKEGRQYGRAKSGGQMNEERMQRRRGGFRGSSRGTSRRGGGRSGSSYRGDFRGHSAFLEPERTGTFGAPIPSHTTGPSGQRRNGGLKRPLSDVDSDDEEELQRRRARRRKRRRDSDSEASDSD